MEKTLRKLENSKSRESRQKKDLFLATTAVPSDDNNTSSTGESPSAALEELSGLEGNGNESDSSEIRQRDSFQYSEMEGKK